MTTPLSLLVPAPQQLESREGSFTLSSQPLIYLAGAAHSLHSTGQYLLDHLETIGLSPELTAADVGDPSIRLGVSSDLLPRAQSYRIVIDRAGVHVIGGDAPGLFYGVCTLIQLARLHLEAGEVTLPHLQIVDWPDFPHRGLMLDVTRDKVPTMETLYDLVELLASLKINQLQLYTEHTFAYRGHEEVWQQASPLTGAEILALDDYCRQHFIELVPNQNSFGHMHRWLRYDRYRPLAEIPEGWLHPFQEEAEPFSICPSDPGSAALLEDLYDQLLPHFSSGQFNVGLDETFDLGMGRSKELCEERGSERIYLDFVLKIYEMVRRRGRTMQFWGDIIVKHPDLIAELPKDAIALEWGYEANHPFAEHGKRFADAGLSFYVCPGTSSWNSLAGRTDNALGNLRNAAINGKKNGAIGFLNTDWGDFGHMQPLSASYVGYLAGAAYSWNVASAEDEQSLDLPALLDRHIFQDEAGIMGRLAYDLGNAYGEAGEIPSNGSILFWQFVLPNLNLEAMRAQSNSQWLVGFIEQLHQMTATANFDGVSEYMADVMANLEQARMIRADAALIQDEFRWAADMLQFAAKLGRARAQKDVHASLGELPAEQRQILAEELRPLLARQRQVWLARNRPGGLADSTRWAGKVFAQLGGEIC